MERETIYFEGYRATRAAESPRLISSGGSKAGIEAPITITGRGSRSKHVVDSRGAMWELILLGRSSAANPEDFSWAGEPQTGRSVVGGRRGGRIVRGRSSGSTMLVAAAGSRDSIPPSTRDGSDQRGTKRIQESRGEPSESTAFGSVSKKRRTIAKPKDEQRTNEARDHCRRTVLMWFESHRWEYLESKYLNNGERGIDFAKEDLNLLQLEAMDGDEFVKDRRKPNYQDWIESQVTEAIYNSMVAYVAILGLEVGSSDGRGKPELMQLMEKWRDGIAIIKPKGKTVLPGFVEKDLATKIATESRQGVVWLPRSAVIVPQDENVFEGTFGKVWKVTIRGAASIPEWIEFAGKTMKVKKNKENWLQRSAQALACPVDHLGVIKLLYLNARTYKSYSMWWNEESLMNMMAYDRTIVETHKDEILRNTGHDFEARQSLVTYRKHRAYLAWALMYIVDVVHKQDVLHNNLNPNNVMLHFPRDRAGAEFIGTCDWSMATWIQEEAPSNYGKKPKEDLQKHRVKYYCAASKLFHVTRERGTPQSPMRMAMAHKYTIKSESYLVEMLAKKIYRMDATSTLFQQNKDSNAIKVRFE